MFITTGSDDGTAKIWNYDNQRTEKPVMCMGTLQGHIAGITSVSWSPSAAGEEKKAMVLTSSKDGFLKVWKPFDPIVAKTGRIPESSLPKPGSHGSHGAGGASGGGEKSSDNQKHADYVNMGVWKHAGRDAGKKVLSCSDDKTAAIWDVDSGRREFQLKAEGIGHSAEVAMCSWSPDCARILTGAYDMYCMLWSPRNGHHMKTFPTTMTKDYEKNHLEPIWTARFSPEGTDFVTASKDGSARVWDITNGTSTILDDGKDIHGKKCSHQAEIFDACWNKHDSNQIVTCSLDMTAKIWDKRTGRVTHFLEEHNASVWSAVFGNEPGSGGRMVLTCSHDMTALVYDQRLGTPKLMLAGHRGILWQASFSSDDQHIVTCSEDRTARIWNLQTGARRPPSEVLTDTSDLHTVGAYSHSQAVTCAAFMERGEVSI